MRAKPAWLFTVAGFLIVCSFTCSTRSIAVEQCKTTLDCAQQAVEYAAQAGAAAAALQAKVDKLDNDLKALKTSLGGGRILASIEVRGGKVISSSNGVTFDSGTGTVTFANPDKLKVFPLMSYISTNDAYATESVFLKTLPSSPTSVTVWQGAQDTTGRSHPPIDFIAVIFGF
jgi:hypothetical protein